MGNLRSGFEQLGEGQEGATLVEYALLAALIAAACLAAVSTFGQALPALFQSVSPAFG